ncbi:MAG: SPFH domain-containing protein [bacterium]|nr:SPFH domain-containing protein [bacterium]
MSIFQIVGGFFLLWAVILVVLSIVLVETGSIAVVFRFKKFVRVLRPGLRFTIPFVETVEHLSTQTHQHELPDEPENIDRVNDTPTEGKKLPFRIVHSSKEEAFFYRKKREGDPTVESGRPVTEWNKVHFRDLLDEDEKKRSGRRLPPRTSHKRDCGCR